jgi:flavodoxin
MKITTSIIQFLLGSFLCFSACSSSEFKDLNAEKDPTVDPDKVLIVYLSRTSNTKAIAEIIHSNVGGTMVALELETPYPENYQATVQQVVRENETGFLPPLKTKIENIQKYELVFVGFPTWGMKLPPPMKSFLSQYSLAGKTVVPFNTNGGYGTGTSFDTVKELCPNSKVLEGFTISGGREREGQLLLIKDEKREAAAKEVKQWLTKIKLVKGS